VTKASLLSFRESFGFSAPPILTEIRERGCDLPRGEGGPGFESPSEFGVLACTHLLHRGPSPAWVKKKKKSLSLLPARGVGTRPECDRHFIGRLDLPTSTVGIPHGHAMALIDGFLLV
jgi:hypothetical protein